MLHLVTILMGAALAAATTHSPAPSDRCGGNFGATPFYGTAGIAHEVVADFITRLGPEPSVLVGENSIRDRLDRAFVRHLIARFDVLAPGIVRETTVSYRNRVHEVVREPGVSMTIRHEGSLVPVLEWQQHSSVSTVSAREALEVGLPRADRWLVLDPNHGLAVFRKFLNDEIVGADHAVLENELKARTEFYARAREYFNRRPKGLYMVDELWRPHRKR